MFIFSLHKAVISLVSDRRFVFTILHKALLFASVIVDGRLVLFLIDSTTCFIQIDNILHVEHGTQCETEIRCAEMSFLWALMIDNRKSSLKGLCLKNEL